MKLLIVLAACVVAAVAQTGRDAELATCIGSASSVYTQGYHFVLTRVPSSTCKMTCFNVDINDVKPPGTAGSGPAECTGELKSYVGNDFGPIVLHRYPFSGGNNPGNQDCKSAFSNRCCCYYDN